MNIKLLLLLLVIFSFIFSYFDIKYKKIPNFVSAIAFFIVLLVGIYIGFIQKFFFHFFIRFIGLFFSFYILYIQGRIAGGDFKIYFVISSLAMYIIYSTKEYNIDWFYFDIHLIFYSLMFGFIFLSIRYILLFLYKLIARNLILDEIVRLKFKYDFEDAYIHFQMLVRIIIYGVILYFTYFFLGKNETIVYFLIVVLEFLFIRYVFSYLKVMLYLPFQYFFRKKQFKFVAYIFLLYFIIFAVKIKEYSLIFLVIIFSFIEYILAFLQLNFDVYIEKVDNLRKGDKLSFRNFKFDFREGSLLEDYEVDTQLINQLKINNVKYVEVVKGVSFGIFLVLGVWYFLIRFLFF